MNYRHGIYTSRTKTKVPAPKLGKTNITVAIGTAPVNRAEDPYGCTNVPIVINDKGEADKYFGVSENFEKYTLLHAIYAFFNKFAVGPLVLINVLDPKNNNHIEAVTDKSITLTGGKAVIEDEGILLDKLVLSDGASKEYVNDSDYVASFDDYGNVVIAVTNDGELVGKDKVFVSYSKLKPDGVKDEDIIGGIDESENRSGVELFDEIYTRLGVVPGIAIAPGFSKSPKVAAALEAKVQLINGLINAFAIIDLDSSSKGAVKPSDVAKVKSKNVVASRWNLPVWPMAKADGYKIYLSAMAAALLQKTTFENDNIPSDSPDNHNLMIDGLCLEDGTDIYMTQDTVNNYINAYGVASAIKLPDWKFWGNNTAAYPVSEDPAERWIKCVMMLNYIENRFKLEYMSSVGRSGNYKLVNGIVNEFNMVLNSLTPDHLANGNIVFNKKDNPMENIIRGKFKFKTEYADYVPAEVIENEFSYSIDMLETALEGGQNE